MIEQITKLIEQVSSSEIKDNGISSEVAGKVTEETGQSIISGFKNSLSTGDFGSLTSLLGGSTSNLMSNPIVKSIIGNLITNLTSKLGLSEGVAGSFANSVIPKIIGAIATKSQNGDNGFEVSDLLGTLGNGDSKDLLGSLTGGKANLGGAIDALKGLF